MNLKNQGIACILITHKMEEVFGYSDRVTVLRDGKTNSTYNREEITEELVKRYPDYRFDIVLDSDFSD